MLAQAVSIDFQRNVQCQRRLDDVLVRRPVIGCPAVADERRDVRMGNIAYQSGFHDFKQIGCVFCLQTECAVFFGNHKRPPFP